MFRPKYKTGIACTVSKESYKNKVVTDEYKTWPHKANKRVTKRSPENLSSNTKQSPEQ